VAARIETLRRTGPAPAIAGAGIALAGTALAIATLVLVILDRQSATFYSLPGLDTGWSQVVRTVVVTLGLITFSVIGGVIVWRRPRSLLSLLYLVLMVSLWIPPFAGEYATYGLVVAPGSLPLADVAAWIPKFSTDLGFIGGVVFVLNFPDGRLMSARWWPLALITILALACDLVIGLNDPYPLWVGMLATTPVPVTVPPALWPIGASLGFLSGVVSWAQPVTLLLVAVYLVRRLTSAAGEVRLQLKWFAYAATLATLTLALAIADNPPPLDWLPDSIRSTLQQFAGSETAHAIASWSNLTSVLTGWVLLPLAIGVAMVRYRLYDIDVVINKTILYGGLAIFVTVSYGIVVGGVGSLLGQRTGLDPILAFVTIGLLALLLLPVRVRLQDLANSAVYGKRAKPYDVLSDFAASIGRAEPADVLLPRMAHLLRVGTGASVTEVWAKVGDRLQLAASSPDTESQPDTVLRTEEIASRHAGGASVEPVFHEGQVLGALLLVKPRGEELNTVERRLLHDLASQAGLVLGRFRLVQELRESRARIVASQDVERNRIQRNLHDGAQQRFVNALLALGMAQAEGGHEASRDVLLGEASSEVRAGLNELRILARGLQSPLLAEAGLVAAISDLADRAAVPTTVTATIDRRCSESIESAAYFFVAEALTNAVKHSAARTIGVTISEKAGRLSIEVRDDGVGGADLTRGSGIIGLQDRLAAAGGRLTLESPSGVGTVIGAELPCA
jgi:signal transduction histidine kinase